MHLAISSRTTVRFLRYTSVGVSTFLLDLGLLVLFIEVLAVHYLAGAFIAYAIAVTLNHFLARRFVFRGTHRSLRSGLVNFYLITAAGGLLVVVLMYLAIDLFTLSPVVARVLVAGVVGMWSYLMNLYVNFRVAGEPLA